MRRIRVPISASAHNSTGTALLFLFVVLSRGQGYYGTSSPQPRPVNNAEKERKPLPKHGINIQGKLAFFRFKTKQFYFFLSVPLSISFIFPPSLFFSFPLSLSLFPSLFFSLSLRLSPLLSPFSLFHLPLPLEKAYAIG